MNRGRDAPGLLLEAAKRLEPRDAALALETYLDAILAFQFLDRLAAGRVLRRSRRPRGRAGGWDPLDSAEPYRTCSSTASPRWSSRLRRSGAEIEAGAGGVSCRESATATELRWAWAAAYVAFVMWDDWVELCMRWIQLARDAGALEHC